ncbi:MAG TPA: response regulator transcription factor [Naasia sp.]
MTTRIRVAVVDDQPLFVSGMRMLIDSQADMAFVGSAADGVGAVDLVRTTETDIVLMDVRMPVLDGIEATRRIATEHHEDGPRVIVLTTFRRDEAVFRAIRAGASGFITKSATPEFVLDAIRTVHQGASVLGPESTLQLVREFVPARHEPSEDVQEAIAALTPREREIFLLVARGLSNADIAAAAFVTEATAKTHISAILSKLALTSRVQVVVFAYENHLLRP